MAGVRLRGRAYLGGSEDLLNLPAEAITALQQKPKAATICPQAGDRRAARTKAGRSDRDFHICRSSSSGWQLSFRRQAHKALKSMKPSTKSKGPSHQGKPVSLSFPLQGLVFISTLDRRA